ncbi:MAG: homoserine dehydrogenase, partial [Nitrososphaerales archaeon]
MRIVLAGFGVVGQSFAELLAQERRKLASSYGLVPRLVAVVDSGGSVVDEGGLDVAETIARKRKTGTVGRAPRGGTAGVRGERGDDGERARTTAQTITDTEADVMVETTPTEFRTGEPGLSHIRAAFISKKSVITCNKGPLGIAFHALRELARHNSVEFRYSGAVGGGTPILDFGRTCSIGDEITKVTGILNGTCNFILTVMERDRLDFSQALELAQREGYAETDPSLDVNGFDSAVKLAIIANHLGLSRATVRDVRVAGIADITPERLARAAEKGTAVRLVATADGSRLSVEPTLVPRDDPLCISGPYNAV